MPTKLLSTLTFTLASFAIGALLGRRWTGDFADTVLTLVALLALGLIITRMVIPWSPRKRKSRTAATPAPETQIVSDKHFDFVHQDGKWMLQVQNVLGVQFAEIDVSLPLEWFPNRTVVVTFAAHCPSDAEQSNHGDQTNDN